MNSPRRSFGKRRRTLSTRPGLVLLASLLTAGALALVVYLVSTSLPYLAASPTADPSFGALNACLMKALPEGRAGFAISPDGQSAAAYGRGQLVLCRATRGEPQTQTLPVLGVRHAAFDFESRLWFATEPTDSEGASLWELPPGAAQASRVGDLAPRALAGHAHGVVALESTGRLVSLDGAHAVTGHAQLPSPVEGEVQLSADVTGEHVALVAGSGVFAFSAKDLHPLRAEGPCHAEYLWWSTEPARAIVSCAPKASWALTLQVETGERDAAPAKSRTRSVLAQRAKVYVQACEHLPCTAPEP